jgi:hypothetical protein
MRNRPEAEVEVQQHVSARAAGSDPLAQFRLHVVVPRPTRVELLAP